MSTPDETLLAYSRAEAARRLGVHVRSLERAERRGDLRVVRLGGRVLVPRSEIERILGLAPAEHRDVHGAQPMAISSIPHPR